MQLTGCSMSTAQRKVMQVRNANGKASGKSITLKEYCKYEDFNYDDVVKSLYKND